MRGAALALALAPGALGAQGAGEPVGALVTVAADASRQHLARLPDGRIRVVYEAPDADGSGIWLRRYDAAGEPLDGAPLALNTVTAGAQERPRLALAPDGRGWVVWQSLNVDGSSRGIVARRLAEDGRPLGEPLLVNLTTDQDQTFPDVAADAQGGALIAWQSFLQDGDNNGVYARRFAADGQPLSGEIALAQLTADSQQQASVAMRPDGRALVAWTSFAVPGGAIQLRELDASGTPLGDEFSIDPATVGGQTGGVVAIGANGQAWVAWQSFSVDNSGTGIAARTRAPAGGFDGPVLALNASGAGNQTAPQIAVDADGRLAAVWQDEASGGALARRFAADGRPLTEEQPLAASLARAALAVDADGDGVYGWIDAGGARLQRLLGAEPIDLGLGAETDTDPVTPGSALRARFTVRNPVTPRAPSGVAAIDRAIGEVRELHLDVTLPEGARFRSVLGSDSGWRCESPVGSFLHCLQAAPLAAGGETTLQLNLDAPPTSGLATIEALIETLPRLDPAVDNDRAALTVRVQPPTVSVLTPTLTLREGGGSGVLVLGIAPPAGTTVSIPFTRSGSAGSEDVTLSASPLQVPAGASTARLAVSVRDDSLDEPLETLTVQLLSPDGAVLGSPDQAQISVEDNDEAPLLRFSASSLARSESAGSVNLLLQLSEPSSQEVRVALTVSGTATAGVDFQAPSRRLVLPAGSRSLSVPLTLIDDALDEADETVVLSLSNPRGAQLGSPASLTLTLQDDDPSPSLRLQRSSLSLVEGAAAETVQVRLSEASTREVRATLAAEGSASASDYRLDTLQLSIPPGALEAAFTLEALADSLDEADESLTLSLSGLENAVAGVPAALEVVVVDATPPTAAFVLAAQTVDEDAGTVELRVRLSSPSREAVSLPFSLGGEALAGEDVIVSASPLVIAAGQTEGRITLNVVDDSLDEINERLILTLGSPQGALLGSPQVHSLTLRDDDAAPLLSFARSDSRVAEGGELAIELLLSAASGQTIEANLAVGGTADGEDYGLSPLPLRIAPGTLSARLVLNALADSRREGSETVTLSLQDASGAVLRDPTLHTVTVDDSTRASGDDDDGGGSLGLGLLGLLGLAAVRRRVAATMGA